MTYEPTAHGGRSWPHGPGTDPQPSLPGARDFDDRRPGGARPSVRVRPRPSTTVRPYSAPVRTVYRHRPRLAPDEPEDVVLVGVARVHVAVDDGRREVEPLARPDEFPLARSNPPLHVPLARGDVAEDVVVAVVVPTRLDSTAPAA